jgi:hypothetical protein
MTETLSNNIHRSLRCIAFLTLRLLPILVIALAAGAAMAADDPYPLASVDTSSPRATLKSFLVEMHDVYEVASAEGRSYESEAERAAATSRILRCFDLSAMPPAVRTSLAKEAALCLKEVLDRIELPPESDWPDSDDVAARKIDKWSIPHTEISIVKIKEGRREGEFLFSADTVERASDFYEIVKTRAYVQRETTTPGFYKMFIAEPGWIDPEQLDSILGAYALVWSGHLAVDRGGPEFAIRIGRHDCDLPGRSVEGQETSIQPGSLLDYTGFSHRCHACAAGNALLRC